MTRFSTVLKEIFLQKFTYVLRFLGIQIFISLLWPIIIRRDMIEFFQISNGDYLGNLFSIFVESTVIIDILFLIVLCIKNEKINFSQTWNLVPVSNVKLYWANILSTFLACVTVFIPQLIIGFGIESIILMTKHESPVAEAISFITNDFGGFSDSKIIMFLIYIISLVLLIQLVFSFANFSAQSISDFMPSKNPKRLKRVVLCLISFIGANLFNLTLNLIDNLYISFNHHFADNPDFLIKNRSNLFWINLGQAYLPVIFMVIASIIFSIINILLFKKYVESKDKLY